jgi:hypothetical protein
LTAGTNAALNPGTGNFTFECWIYATSTPTNLGIFQGNLNGFSIGFNPSSQLAVSQAGVAYLINDSATFTLLNQWVHIAVARSSTTLSLYKNGTRVATATNSTAFVTSTQTYIASNGTVFFSGYVANLRLINGGTTVYDPTQTTITIPTSPVGNTANTSLLLNMANAGIYDAAAQNDVTTVSNAQTSSTPTAQWPPTSMKFNGSTDYLRLVDSPVFDFGSSDFTIEAWVYTASTNNQIIYGRETTSLVGILFQVSSGLTVGVNLSSNGSAYSLVLTGGSISASTWTYVAVTRVGSGTNNIKLFLGTTPGGAATQVAQNTFSGSIYTTTGMTPIVGARNTNAIFPFSGYIQDLRITRGVGRTISTVPSAAFPTR